MEKVNIIEFCIFELVYVPNFRLTDNFDVLNQICAKRVFPIRNVCGCIHGRYLLPYRKKNMSAKNDEFFASDKFFCRLFFYWRDFMPTVNSTDEYSYRHFFYKRVFVFYKHLVFSNWKIPLAYLFDFNIRLKLLKLNKILSVQGNRCRKLKACAYNNFKGFL